MTLQIARLEKQAALLEQFARNPHGPDFDLKTWGTVELRRQGFLWLQKGECGTAACAVGLACLGGAFAAEGLDYRIEGFQVIPCFGGRESWEAVWTFFGLSPSQADRLFDSDAYTVSYGPMAAAAVAARIRALLKRSQRARISRDVKKIKSATIAGAQKTLAPVPTHRENISG